MEPKLAEFHVGDAVLALHPHEGAEWFVEQVGIVVEIDYERPEVVVVFFPYGASLKKGHNGLHDSYGECNAGHWCFWRAEGINSLRKMSKVDFEVALETYTPSIKDTKLSGSTLDTVIVDEMGYPDDNPKTTIGTTKPSLHAIPPVALLEMGAAMADGERKYGLMNWREKKVSSSVYYDAMQRHLLAWYDGEDIASDSGVHHLGHVMACCAILLDAEANGQLNDNRPEFPGQFAQEVQKRTKSA